MTYLWKGTGDGIKFPLVPYAKHEIDLSKGYISRMR